MKTQFILAAALLLTSACAPAALEYAPRTDLITELGADEAKARLVKLLSQATAPQVMAKTVEVGDDYYFYQALDIAMFGRGFVSKKVYIPEVQSAEITESKGRYYVQLNGTAKLDRIRWSSEHDAKEFADLVLSLKVAAKK